MRVDQMVNVRWTGNGDVYEGGRPDGPRIVIDSDAVEGPSPVDTLLLGLASCMAIDVRVILEKSRVAVESLSVVAEAERNEDPPRRVRKVRLVYRLTGPEPNDMGKIQRAIDLSRDRYCSVLQSLRTDIEFTIEAEIG